MLGAIHAPKKLHGKRLEFLDEAGKSPLTIMSFAAFLPPTGCPRHASKMLTGALLKLEALRTGEFGGICGWGQSHPSFRDNVWNSDRILQS